MNNHGDLTHKHDGDDGDDGGDGDDGDDGDSGDGDDVDDLEDDDPVPTGIERRYGRYNDKLSGQHQQT